jgi:hypothetical protein
MFHLSLIVSRYGTRIFYNILQYYNRFCTLQKVIGCAATVYTVIFYIKEKKDVYYHHIADLTLITVQLSNTFFYRNGTCYHTTRSVISWQSIFTRRDKKKKPICGVSDADAQTV